MIKFFFIFILFSYSSLSFAGSLLSSIYENNKAIVELSLKPDDTKARLNLDKAEQGLLQALAEDPFNPIFHINLGIVFEAQKKPDMALKEYESALRIQNLNEELQFIADFNAGNAAAHIDPPNKDLALQHYQAALDLKPDSKEVKTNIELLFQGGGKGKGQGKGKGNGNDKDKNDKGQGDKDSQNNQNKDEQKKQEFKSENLTKEDVRKILEELKSQENKIRANEKESKGKESPVGKDW